MVEYTAEDFAQADLATRGEFGAARRTDPNLTHQWHAYGSRQGYFSDEEMAADGWVPVVESRITLGGLKAAWEAAERTGECSAGDVLIRKLDRDDYNVYRADAESHALSADVRILSRAPRREPWADLADAFKTWDYPVMGYEEELAKWVYAKGVRMTGGDDDE